MNNKLNEANRYVLSYALLGGSSFRRDVINRAKDKHNASSIELGLKKEGLLKACLFFESRENKYRAAFIGLTIFVFISMAAESIELLAISCFALVFTQLIKSYRERFDFVRQLKSREFDADDFVAKLNVNFNPDLYPGISASKEQNVSIYKGFVPFQDAGLEVGGWSFAVDLSRSKENLGAKSTPEPFGIFEIYGALSSAIEKLGIPNMVTEDHLFVSGSDIGEIHEILPDKYSKPNQSLDEKTMAPYQTRADGIIRHYKWIKVYDWGNDLINSFFVRFEMRGDNLFLEASKYLLTPIDTRFRKLDRVLPYTFMNNYLWFMGAIIRTVFSVVTSLIYGYINIMSSISEALGFAERARKKLIRNTPYYNYGAPISIRKKLSSPNFMHYFQRMDNEMYLKTLERQIIDATVDFLENHNIDVSEIKERGSTILNSGVFVQGGDVKAGVLAVGKGAKAKSGGLFSKGKSKQPA